MARLAPLAGGDNENEIEEPQVHGMTWDARVQVVADEETWIVITDSVGNLIFSGILKPGDMILIPNQEDVVMAAGITGALSIVVDGVEVKSSGPKAAAVTNLSLSAEQLLADEFLAEVALVPNKIAFGIGAR
jgi:hypothetical protein